MATTYTYSIVEVEKDKVISKIDTYNRTIFATHIVNGTHINCNEIPISQIKEMTATNDYVYYYINEKASK